MAQETIHETQVKTVTFNMPVIDEKIAEIITVPGVQAYHDSPHWKPIVCPDGVIYVWPSESLEEIEAILLPETLIDRSYLWTLYTVTRSKKSPYVVVVKKKIPGSRISNIFKEPAMTTNMYKNEFIIQWLLIKTNILEKLKLQNCKVDIDVVKCDYQDYEIIYSVHLHFNELYFIPTLLRKEKQ